jgi:hemoglobin
MFPSNTCFMVVDESSVQRREVMTMLERLGFTQVVKLGTVQQAIQHLNQRAATGKPLDAVISGWSMPDMSGLELLTHMRASFPKPPPFVLLNDTEAQAQLAKEMGASACVTKPFSERALRNELEALWNRENAKAAVDGNAAPALPPTLFDKYGGIQAVSELVRMFYAEVLKRKHLAWYFRDVSPERLILHQIHFVALVMGRPPEFYRGRDVSSAHVGRFIEAKHFDEFADLLKASLIRANIEADDRTAIMAQVAALKPQVVGR